LVEKRSMLEQTRFCSEEHSITKQLAAQAWGAFTITWWTVSFSFFLWTVFAVSELARARELTPLDQADELLCEMVSSQPQAEGVELWVKVANQSALARKVLYRHGWDHSGFIGGSPNDVWSLRRELQQTRGLHAETALEIKGVRLFMHLAWFVHKCPLFPYASFVRLRIAPVAELSGLGASAMQGGQLYSLMPAAGPEEVPLAAEVRGPGAGRACPEAASHAGQTRAEERPKCVGPIGFAQRAGAG